MLSEERTELFLQALAKGVAVGRDDSDRRKRTRISGNGPRAERGTDTRFGIETVYRRDADLWDCGSTDTGHGPEGTGRNGMQINLYKCTFF